MRITSAQFIQGIVGETEVLADGTPQVAFIGRSNVGKSSLINSLTGQKGLARTSSFPGRTQEINLFKINKTLYMLDLPGYGYARKSAGGRARISDLINWYLFDSEYPQKKIVLIIDAYVGPTESDIEMLKTLEEEKKSIVVVANKVDRIKSSEYQKQMKKIQTVMGNNRVIAYSTVKKIGIKELTKEILE